MQKHKFNPKWEKYRDEYTEYFISRFKYKNEVSKRRSYYLCRTDINQLYEYLKRRDIKSLNEIKGEHLEDLQKYLYIRNSLLPRTIKRKLLKLKMFFSYLVHKDILQKNPSNDIKLFNPGRIQVKRYYSIQELVDRYSNHIKRMRLSKMARYMKMKEISLFVGFLNDHLHKSSLYKVTEVDITEYREYLKHYQYEPDRYYSPYNQVKALRTLKQFLRTLYIKGYLHTQLMKNFNCEEHKQELEKLYNTELNKPDPDSLIPLELRLYRDRFLDNLKLSNYSESSIRSYKRGIAVFLKYLGSRQINGVKQIDKTVIIEYQDYLKTAFKAKDGKSPSIASISHKLSELKGFLKYLLKMGCIEVDYTVFIDIPKKCNGIPHTVMTEREINIILNKPDILTTMGLRDKTVLEILYSSGLRATELANVKIDDIDISSGLIRINKPKGGEAYQRVVPIGRVACYYVKRYLKGSRPELISKTNTPTDYLILTWNGNQTNNHIINDIVRKYAEESGIRKHITPHSFRVTCATLMLKNNADIRYVQEQLGHRSIHSTQIYTRLVPKDLKKIHQMCHPREKK